MWWIILVIVAVLVVAGIIIVGGRRAPFSVAERLQQRPVPWHVRGIEGGDVRGYLGPVTRAAAQARIRVGAHHVRGVRERGEIARFGDDLVGERARCQLVY